MEVYSVIYLRYGIWSEIAADVRNSWTCLRFCMYSSWKLLQKHFKWESRLNTGRRSEGAKLEKSNFWSLDPFSPLQRFSYSYRLHQCSQNFYFASDLRPFVLDRLS